MTSYIEALEQQIAVAKMIVPSKSAEEHLTAMIADMHKDNQNASDILVQVVLYIADGLRYGNWGV